MGFIHTGCVSLRSHQMVLGIGFTPVCLGLRSHRSEHGLGLHWIWVHTGCVVFMGWVYTGSGFTLGA